MRVQNYLRRDVMVAQQRDVWAAIQYIPTAENVYADLLSRSFTADGQDKPEVLAEFHTAVAKLGLVATETRVPTRLVEELLPAKVRTCDLEQLERYAMAACGTDQQGVQSPSAQRVQLGNDGSTVDSLELLAARRCAKWTSPSDTHP